MFRIVASRFNSSLYTLLSIDKFLDSGKNYKTIIQAMYNIISYAKPSASMLHAIRRLTTSRPAYESFSDMVQVRDKLLSVKAIFV